MTADQNKKPARDRIIHFTDFLISVDSPPSIIVISACNLIRNPFKKSVYRCAACQAESYIELPMP